MSFLFRLQILFAIFELKRVNIITGQKEQRILLTGLHTVCDIYCKGCNNNVGWKYVKFKYFSIFFQIISSLIN